MLFQQFLILESSHLLLPRTMADSKILETFPNPTPQRDFIIEHTHHEFTSVCPMTGHPDFATILVRYVAEKTCVELKSLKLYFHAYRNEGIFFEAARGGFSSRVTAEWTPPVKKRRKG
jgi:7-cyano-7-deazaguanine reductase